MCVVTKRKETPRRSVLGQPGACRGCLGRVSVLRVRLCANKGILSALATTQEGDRCDLCPVGTCLGRPSAPEAAQQEPKEKGTQ